jgi:hypothetical protein
MVAKLQGYTVFLRQECCWYVQYSSLLANPFLMLSLIEQLPRMMVDLKFSGTKIVLQKWKDLYHLTITCSVCQYKILVISN